MSATSPLPPRRCGRRPAAQAGIVALEFALLALIFFTFLFSLMEVARALYLWNTVQEVTRRAARTAAVSDFSDPAAMEQVRSAALFGGPAGTLGLGGPITSAHVRIDYLSLALNADASLTPLPMAALPGCPKRNLINCINDPNGASCIRFVRVRLCQPAGADQPDACAAVSYTPLMPLLALTAALPLAPTVVKAETLGYRADQPLCAAP